ncbi:biopolymer transporter ExbD [Paracoccaceae bacterium GXU_MW_L88]
MIKRREKRRRRLSLTSLIDVIFLLLLFFMLSSTFTKFAEVELVSAAQGSGTTQRAAPPLFIRLDGETARIGANEVALEDVANEAAARRGESETALISLTETVNSQSLVTVLTALREIDGLNVRVLR